MLNVLDVCTGIGSFSIGAESAGFNTVMQVEIESERREILAKHFPDSIRLGDLYNVTKKDVPGRIDLLAGGTPCQDLSLAGNRNGLSGTRSNLWFEYLRLAQELAPKWLVWENVPGALSSNGGRDFRTILMGLDELGYHVAWRVLDAQYFGVPQRRRRIFLIGHLADGRASKVLFESKSLPGNSTSRPKTWKTTPRRIGTLSHSTGGVSRNDYKSFRFLANGYYTEDDISKTLMKKDDITTGDLIINPVIKIDNTKSNGQGVLTDGTTHTLGGSTDAVLDNDKSVRRLTPLECERLQGFPDHWTKGFSDTKRYSMLGDSIAVPCSKWIMQRIAENE